MADAESPLPPASVLDALATWMAAHRTARLTIHLSPDKRSLKIEQGIFSTTEVHLMSSAR